MPLGGIPLGPACKQSTASLAERNAAGGQVPATLLPLACTCLTLRAEGSQRQGLVGSSWNKQELGSVHMDGLFPSTLYIFCQGKKKDIYLFWLQADVSFMLC